MIDQKNDRHLLISFSASWGAEGAVETGVELATILGLEVTGIFAQQETATQLFGFPFAKAFLPGGYRAEPITQASMLQAMQRQSAYCRKLLNRRAEQYAIKWSFLEVKQQANPIESKEVDYLILPGVRGFADDTELWDVVRKAAVTSRVVVVSGGNFAAAATGPVLAIIDTSMYFLPIVEQAVQLCSNERKELVIVLMDQAGAAPAKVQETLQAVLPSGLQHVAVSLPGHSVPEILAMDHQLQPSFVVADLNAPPFSSEESARSLLRSINSPILLVAQKSSK